MLCLGVYGQGFIRGPHWVDFKNEKPLDVVKAYSCLLRRIPGPGLCDSNVTGIASEPDGALSAPRGEETGLTMALR